MLRLLDAPDRREWLRLGALSAFGLSLPGLLAAGSTRSSGGKAKACIVLFHLGGPPQHETWDPKPDAPAEIRGEFKPIGSSVPGIRVGELMPKTARLLDRICVLRALSTNDNAHSSSGYWMLTGQAHQPTNSENSKPGAPNDWPSVAAIVQHLRGRSAGVPAAMVVPEHIWNDGMLVWPGQDGGFLGRSSDPWRLICDPSQPSFDVPGLSLPADVAGDRFGGRVGLLERYNKTLDGLDASRAVERFDVWNRQALDLLRSNAARKAFHLDDEPDRLRERYGRNRWGQSVLLARRLVEAGVGLVQVNWTRMASDAGGSPAWDTHARNAQRCKDVLCPLADQAYSALLEDLEVRGLLDETLVVWMGEFGRTPKHNGNGGRDHWGHVFSGALAGSGVQGGRVIGASDGQGAFPKDGVVRPQDLTAAIFHALGYRPDTEMHDTLGRPLPISRGVVPRGVFQD